MEVPQHLAVIMDGNGRWAKTRGLPRIAGHREGAKAARALVEACMARGIAYLTLYAFSAENWHRPQKEVQELMALLVEALERELPRLVEAGVRLKVIGQREGFTPKLQARLQAAEAETRGNKGMQLTLALGYGARQELVAMAAQAADVGRRDVDFTPDSSWVARHLTTCNLPDPDLLIRTGGEQRLSNFLLWQLAYTELYFSATLWPDFGVEALEVALQDFATRERRFGVKTT